MGHPDVHHKRRLAPMVCVTCVGWLALCASRPWADLGKTDLKSAAQEAAAPSDQDVPSLDDARHHVLAGDFKSARTVLQQIARTEGDDAEDAALMDHYLAAIGFGDWTTAESRLSDELRTPRASRAAVLLARLWSLKGQHAKALGLLAKQQESSPPEGDWVRACEQVMAIATGTDEHRGLAKRVLAIEPWNVVAARFLLEGSLAARDFPSVLHAWDRLQLRDYYGRSYEDALNLDVRRAIEGALSSDRTLELARSLARAGWVQAAWVLLQQAQDSEETTALRAKLQPRVELRDSIVEAWTKGLAKGLADGAAQAETIRLASTLAKASGETSLPGWYRTLRDEERLCAILVSFDALSLYSDVGIVMNDGPRVSDEVLEGGAARRVMLGPSLFRMKWVLHPLLGPIGYKGIHRSDWPDCIVMQLDRPVHEASHQWRVLVGADRDPGADLPPIIPADAGPGTLVSAYPNGNQGTAALESARSLALVRAVTARTLLPGRSASIELGFVRIMARSDLEAIELHELQHATDTRRGGAKNRAQREKKAFLRELASGSRLAQLNRLATVALGGEPASPDPYEVANYEILYGFVLALFQDRTIAPQLDYERSLQAQLHALTEAQVRTIAASLL